MSLDPLGTGAGSVSDLSADALTNSYTNIADTPVDAITDRVVPRQVASGTTRGIQQLGSDKIYSDGGNQQIIVEDDTVPRVLMGQQATFGEGFYVTKPTVNVKTNTDATQFIFNSNQNVFKIAKTGTATLVTTDSTKTASVSIPHNQTIIPAVLCYAVAPPSSNFSPKTAYPVYGGGYVNLPYIISTLQTITGLDTTLNLFFMSYEVDATNLILRAQQLASGLGSSTNSTTFKYFILQESAN